MGTSSKDSKGTKSSTKTAAKSVSKKSEAEGAAKRRSIRFNPDEGAMAWIDVRRSSVDEEFLRQHPALIVNESFKGCGLICMRTYEPKVGQKMWLQVGGLAPVVAEVMWVESASDCAYKIGVKYLI